MRYAEQPPASISSNPAAVNIETGNGALQDYIEKKLNIKNDHGIHFSGSWLGDANQLFSGGIPDADKSTLNSLLLLDLDIDTEEFVGWKGGLFGIQLLQVNAQNTNNEAGSEQGYNSIPGAPPLNRFELYQLWFRQEFFNKKLIVRIGKQVPTYGFNNVVKPIALTTPFSLPAVSGLLYSPVFINPTLRGVMPGYYNSAYGITLNLTPVKEWYLSYGIYDGNLARGEQIGLHATPTFNGANFQIAETGFAWLLGSQHKPGNFALGIWHQHGTIQGPPNVFENNASGYYLFGSQRLWNKNPGIDNSGLSGFYQYGQNNSNVMEFCKYVGAGLTTSGLIANRLGDSLGLGAAFAWLNPRLFNNHNELMLQVYYQAKVMNGLFVEPALTYIPNPGANNSRNNALAATVRMIVLF